jgi:nucleotide-binding universal stress UspA family protein
MIMPAKLVESMTGKTYEKYCPMIFSRILCPTNFSEFSEQSAALAGTTSGTGEIILLHVVPEGEGGPAAGATAEERIQVARDRLTAQGIRARTIVVTGKPEVEIPRIAREEDVSLIWMRSAAKGCLHDFFFGSMLHDIIMNATQPVVIIRSYKE